MRVVEQSRQNRPFWVEGSLGTLADFGSHLDYHLIKTSVLDLPLGMRQAESSAVNDAKLLIKNELQYIWQQNFDYRKLEDEDRLAVGRYLQSLLDQKVTSELIHDIYYEKLFDPSRGLALQDTYTIHILLQLPRAILQALLIDLRSYCHNSMRKNLIQLSKKDDAFLVK